MLEGNAKMDKYLGLAKRAFPMHSCYNLRIICGLTEHSSKGHFVRAAYEAVAFQVKDILEAMNTEGGFPFSSLQVDGGMTNNGTFQFS